MLLSRNYPPSAELEPFIARHYAFSAALPEDFELVDRLLAETAFIRILLKGEWVAEIAPGIWGSAGRTVFFGPNGVPLRVRCRGPFTVVGIAIRPCGWHALFDNPASLFADRMLPLEEVWGDTVAAQLLSAVEQADDDGAIVAAVEAIIAELLAWRGCHRVNNPMRIFEHLARNDSTMRVHDAAARLNLSERQFERHCLGCFGHMPKTVLRRSRFLDMATVMRGLADPSDADLASLRYFDQSHLNREFRRFIGMTPSEFMRTPTPLLNAGLELRQERKAEARKPGAEYRAFLDQIA